LIYKVKDLKILHKFFQNFSMTLTYRKVQWDITEFLIADRKCQKKFRRLKVENMSSYLKKMVLTLIF